MVVSLIGQSTLVVCIDVQITMGVDQLGSIVSDNVGTELDVTPINNTGRSIFVVLFKILLRLFSANVPSVLLY